MTGIVVTVGMVAAAIFGLGLLVGMGVGTFILHRAEDHGRDAISKVARRLTG
jgi:divalent metal cation (Fe/Co/Zn/Cd) transporter